MAQRDSGKKKGRQLTEQLRYRPQEEWTFEQALADDALFRGGIADPTRPIYRWAAMRELDGRHRKVVNNKSGFDVLAAVCVCALNDLVMPDWLVREFINRYRSVLHCHVGSWDDAFGRPYPKGKHLAALRKARRHRVGVFVDVIDMVKRGRKINKELFKEVGKVHDLGATLAEKLYYEEQLLNPISLSQYRKSR